jgi:hypothetical protein
MPCGLGVTLPTDPDSALPCFSLLDPPNRYSLEPWVRLVSMTRHDPLAESVQNL